MSLYSNPKWSYEHTQYLIPHLHKSVHNSNRITIDFTSKADISKSSGRSQSRIGVCKNDKLSLLPKIGANFMTSAAPLRRTRFVTKASDLRIVEGGRPPENTIGYLSPRLGTFTLNGDNANDGIASFTWYHGNELAIDWHTERLRYQDTVQAPEQGGVRYWRYEVVDENGDLGVPVHILFAQQRTNSNDASDSDEGYRIFYYLGNNDSLIHLWAWDATTFRGHGHEH